MGVMTSMILMAANAAVEPKSARMGSDARSDVAPAPRAAGGDADATVTVVARKLTALAGVRHGVGTLVGTLFGTLVPASSARFRDETRG